MTDSVMIRRENPKNSTTYNVSAYDNIGYKVLEKHEDLSKEESEKLIEKLKVKYNRAGFTDFSYWG